MNILPDSKRAEIIKALIEGASIRSVARMTGCSKDTVTRLLVEVGEFCSIYQHHVLVDLPTTRIEMDEIWAFVGAKQKNATKAGQGDCWTFTCIDADSKLMVSWFVGSRTYESANIFVGDVASRLRRRVQVTTDGHNMYRGAVENAFGYNGADYAMLVKSYGATVEVGPGRKYSPMECTGTEKKVIFGEPDASKISTSFVKRANLSMRMGMRRFTRLTNAFSKKAENHAHAVALHFFAYNFIKPHGTLTKAANGVKTTPAMAAEVTSRVWTVEELLSMMRPDFLIQ